MLRSSRTRRRLRRAGIALMIAGIAVFAVAIAGLTGRWGFSPTDHRFDWTMTVAGGGASFVAGVFCVVEAG